MSGLKRILYVEDDPDIQAIAQVALETIGGFTLKVCSSGDEALAEAVAFAPDLILLDVMMPNMDGPSTLQELRKLSSLINTPAIFMTAKAQPQEIEHFKSLGAIEVVPKPFDPMTIAEQIKTIWQQHSNA